VLAGASRTQDGSGVHGIVRGAGAMAGVQDVGKGALWKSVFIQITSLSLSGV
jgi:hypothetical protein